jgi:hypothetical protein
MEAQLSHLQAEVEGLAREFDFNLLSPFADRHGVAEIRFVRVSGEMIESISLACDAIDSRPTWRCQLMSGASFRGQSEWRDVATFRLSAEEEKHETLATHFATAAKMAVESALLVRAKSSRPTRREELEPAYARELA